MKERCLRGSGLGRLVIKANNVDAVLTSDDIEEKLRSRVIMVLASFGLFSTAAAFPLFYALKDYLVMVIITITFFADLLALVVARRHSFLARTLALTAYLVGTLAGTLNAGGIESHALAWLVVLPFIATLVCSRREILIWIALIFSGIMVIAWATFTGQSFVTKNAVQGDQGASVAMVNIVLSFIASGGIAVLAERIRTKILRNLAESNRIVADHKKILEQQVRERTEELTKALTEVEAACQEAERANQTKSIFLANISHELRTPMHGILSFAEIGQEKKTGDAELNDYFREIYDSGQSLMILLNDLLDLAKLDAKKVHFERADVDLLTVASAVLSEYAAFAQKNRITLNVATTGNTAGCFDVLMMTKVFRNIINNAIKFSYPDTTVQIQIADAGNSLHCQFSNQGVGIPAEEITTIFDKFEQSSVTRRKSGGTGLGLAICKEIIILHDGKIWAESEVERQTTFHISLPRQGPASDR